MKTQTRNTLSIVIAVLFAALLFLSMYGLPGLNVDAAPPAAPTPVANILTADKTAFFRFQPATALTANTNTSGKYVQQFNSLDVQYIIDHGTTNTTTLTIQYSNDNTNWVDGLALVTSSAADGTSISRVPLFGAYTRVKQVVTNSNPITITLLAVARQ